MANFPQPYQYFPENLFVAVCDGVTGVAPLGPGGTTAGFCIYNPSGSGVIMQVRKVLVAPIAAAAIVAVLGIEYGTPPSSVGTAVTPASLSVGSSLTATGKAAYGSTIVAMTYLKHLPIAINTTGGLSYNGFWVDDDPMISLMPNSAINIVSSTTQSSDKWVQHVIWSEHPVS